MTGASSRQPGWTATRVIVTAVVACFVELALIFVLGAPEMRFSLLTGFIAGVLGGVGGLFFVFRALGDGVNEALKAVGMGFMLRVVLVGVGLVAVMRTPGGNPIAFVFTFFPLFFVFAALEALAASSRAKEPPTPTA